MKMTIDDNFFISSILESFKAIHRTLHLSPHHNSTRWDTNDENDKDDNEHETNNCCLCDDDVIEVMRWMAMMVKERVNRIELELESALKCQFWYLETHWAQHTEHHLIEHSCEVI